MPWGAAIAAVGAIGGAVISSSAADKAAKAQQHATDTALGEQQREFDTNQANYAPYLDAGKSALGQLQTDINKPVTAADVMSDPGYQFGLDQGQTALDRKIAAMGGRVSGAALKGASQYATNYATTGYNSAYQRSQDRLNRLAALAGIGQTATTNNANSSQATTNAMTGLVTNQGDATAASKIAQGNIWGNAFNQVLGSFSGGAGSSGASNFGAGG
jgi:hypothetical protein